MPENVKLMKSKIENKPHQKSTKIIENFVMLPGEDWNMDGSIVIAVTALIFNLASVIGPVLACELTIFLHKKYPFIFIFTRLWR